MKHVHADLIKLWADGAEIQYYSLTYEKWKDATTPAWDADSEYRIKPQPKPDIVLYCSVGHPKESVNGCMHSEISNAVVIKLQHFELLAGKLELTFHGETRELKDVKIIK